MISNSNGKLSVLVVEDDPMIAKLISRVLQHGGYQTQHETSVEAALKAFATGGHYDLILTDWQLPGRSGMSLIEDAQIKASKIPVVLVTGQGNTDTAIRAVQAGAFDYLTKPFTAEELLDLVGKFEVRTSSSSTEGRLPIGFDSYADDKEAIIGRSKSMQEVYKSIGRIAATEATVMISGETGTGKELVARAVQQYSKRSDKPFEVVNCGAIPETLFESELFGHGKGSFTGAHQRQEGRLERADGGTIFLDEVGELPLAVQVKLLRFLQDGSIQSVGGTSTRKVDVRVIAATNRNLQELAGEGDFRKDLYYRLNVARIHIPPLSERPGDVVELLGYFSRKCAAQLRCESLRLSKDAIEWLQAQRWPGNVRQLENLVRQLIVQYTGRVVDRDTAVRHYGSEDREPSQAPMATAMAGGGSMKDAVAAWIAEHDQPLANLWPELREETERILFAEVMRITAGHQSNAAAILGTTMKTLREKLIRYGMHPRHNRQSPLAGGTSRR